MSYKYGQNDQNNNNNDNLFDRMKSFSSIMSQENSNNTETTTSNSNKHIYFDDSDLSSTSDDDDDDDEDKDKSQKSQNNNKKTSKKKEDSVKTTTAADNNRRMCKLIRNGVTESFGFEVNGKANIKGEHIICDIVNESPACKSGLQIGDKIESINGICVSDLCINNLIKLIQQEAKNNPNYLEFMVCKADNEMNNRKRASSLTNTQTTKNIKFESDLGDVSSKKLTKSEEQASNKPIEIQKPCEIELDINSLGFYSPYTPNKLSTLPSIQVINEKAKEIRYELNEKRVKFTWRDIIYELLKFYNCTHIGQLGLTQVINLDTINDLIRTQRKIDSFVIEYGLTISNTTFHELEKSICKYFFLDNFSKLIVGPLLYNEYARELFSIPSHLTNSEMNDLRITYLDLFRYLRKYLEEKNLWSAKTKLKTSDFENYMKEKMNVDYLPVRINSLPLMIGVIKNVKRIYLESYKQCECVFQQELDQLFKNQNEWIKKELNVKFEKLSKNFETIEWKNEQELSEQMKLVDCSSTELLNDFLNLFETVFYEYEDTNELVDYLKLFELKPYLNDLFKLAVCFIKNSDINSCIKQMCEKKLSRNESKNLFTELLKFIINLLFRKLSKKQILEYISEFVGTKNLKIVYSTKKKRHSKHIRFDEEGNIVEMDSKDDVSEDENDNEKTNENEKMDEIDSQVTQKQASSEEIGRKINELLKEECKNDKQTVIELLCKLEEVVDGYLIENGYSKLNSIDKKLTFLKYLCANKQEFSRLFELVNKIDSKTRTRQGIADQFAQILFNLNLDSNNQFDETQKRMINRLLCDHYGTKTIKEIDSYTDIDCLIEQYRQLTFESSSTIYENTIINNATLLENINDDFNVFDMNNERENLRDLITQCPLLHNLYEFTNWNIFYAHKFGDLKEYLHKSNQQALFRDTSTHQPYFVIGLETMPYNLLKLTSNTSIEQLKESIINLDHINAAGHLVSLISTKYRSLVQAPMVLIANEMQLAFTNVLNSVESNQFYSFVVSFLCRLPIRFASNCLYSLFLIPLVRVEGSLCELKEKLYKMAFLHEKRDHFMSYFRNLSVLCSIPEWSKPIEIECSQVEPSATIETNKAQTFKTEVVIESPNIQLLDNNDNSQPIRDINEMINDTNYDVDSCKLHIEYIRRTKYGIGLDLNEQNDSVMKALKNEISSCLQTLSNELYNKDMHFVLELIQNADDNSYDQTEPTIIFLIDENCITLFNNEIGFKRQNIDAICSVGSSTKGKQTHGYIGRKGIGFKSVFTVTDSPYIYSNGYNIKFNASNNYHFGYIVPVWIESESEEMRYKAQIESYVYQNVSSTRLNTCIHLPLKSLTERQRHKSRSLAHSFNDIQSSILLFLNRLRTIVIVNAAKSMKRVYSRKDIDENLIEIVEDESENGKKYSKKWLIKRKNLQIPENIEKPNGCLNIQSTDLCLAFPIYDQEYLTSNRRLPLLDVFAYLPLRCFNFSFIIQADFVVPASRQDISNDSEWNQWLCKEIPQLFVDSLELFLSYSSNDNKINALKTYLKFIPIEHEIGGFFGYIPKQILHLLRKKAFLPVISEINGEIMYRKPYECVIINDKYVRNVLTSDILEKCLSTYYLDPELYDGSDDIMKLLYGLGVRSIQLSDIIDILKVKFFENNQNLCSMQTTTSYEDISKWLVVLKQCIHNCSLNDEINLLNQVKQLKFIPLLDKEKGPVCLNTCEVYFPSTMKQNVTNEQPTNTEIMKLIEKELNIIDLDVLLCLDEVHLNGDILQLLINLGVKYINSKQIIEKHIIPKYKSNVNNTDALNYLIYLHDCWFNNPSSIDLNSLKQIDRLLTTSSSKTQQNPNEQTIYLSQTYGNKYNLKQLFPDYDWLFIDSSYLEESRKYYSNDKRFAKKENLVNSWRKFFALFGIHDIFSVREYETFNNHEASLNKLVNNTESLVISDYVCDVFDYYTSKYETENDNEKYIPIFQNLFKILQENWTSTDHNSNPFNTFKYVKYYARCKKSNIKREIFCGNTLESTFYTNLKTKKWCIGETIEYHSNSNINVGSKSLLNVYIPSEIYVKDDLLVRYYGYQIPYATSKYDKISCFVDELGFKTKFDSNIFIDYFINSINKSISNQAFVSINQMKAIYNLISYHIDNKINENNEKCLKLVENCQFIFVPSNQSFLFSDDQVQSGQLYKNDQVCWFDPNNLFEKYKSMNSTLFLCKIYSDTNKQLFVNNFKVTETPKLNDYLLLLEHIIENCIKEKYQIRDVLSDVYSIYEVFYGKCCTSSDETILDENLCNNFINCIKQKWIFPCSNNKWVSLDHQPYIVDSVELGELFSEKLNLLVMPNKSSYSSSLTDLFKLKNLNDKCKQFLVKLCKLNYLTNALNSEFIVDGVDSGSNNNKTLLNAAAKIQNFCRLFLTHIQAFLYWKRNYRFIYDKLNTISMNNLKFYCVNKSLKVNYYCKFDRKLSAIKLDNTCYVNSSNETDLIKLYFHIDIVGNEKEVLKGFSRVFIVNNDDLEKEFLLFLYTVNDFVKSPTNINIKSNIEREFEIKLSLPEDEKLWKMSEAVVEPLAESSFSHFKGNRNSGSHKTTDSRGQILTYDDLDACGDQKQRSRVFNFPNSNENFKYFKEFPKITSSEIVCKDITEDFQSVNLTEAKLNELRINTNVSTDSMDEYKMKIGRWGERYVYEMLAKKYENEIKLSIIKLDWINKDNETGHPYDIRLIEYNENCWDEIKNETFIEVKSTSKSYIDNKDYFPLSINELQFAINRPNNYEIYRLYNVGCDNLADIRIRKITNIQTNLVEHNINLLMII